jgi:hypothetical protein
MEPHPDTGARYVVVLPNNPSFDVLWNAYLALECSWFRVIDSSRFDDYFSSLRNTRALIVHFAPPEDIPGDRRCTIAGMYFEAYDTDLAILAPDHRRDFDRFIRTPLDIVGCHTPWMATEIGRHANKPSFVLPHGWSDLAETDWSTPKTTPMAFYGSNVGKRERLFPKLRKYGTDLSGCFGYNLLRQLDSAKTVLNIYHYNVASYSTPRLFQASQTSAALITEDGDIWPLSRENCYMIPRVETEGDVEQLVAFVEDIPEEEALATAQRAYAEMREYSVERCVTEFLVQGTKEWLR